MIRQISFSVALASALVFGSLLSAAPKAAAPAAPKSTLIPVQAAHGSVEFHAVGRPSMIKINGQGTGPEGQLKVEGANVTGDLTFDMTSLSSGISMRDTHMKEKYLEVQKYPQAKLHVTDVSLPADWSLAKPETKDRAFKGDLTMHGQTKPVSGTFDITGGPDAFAIKARFEIKVDDYGVEIPKYLGITVKNEVPVELQMNDLKAAK